MVSESFVLAKNYLDDKVKCSEYENYNNKSVQYAVSEI